MLFLRRLVERMLAARRVSEADSLWRVGRTVYLSGYCLFAYGVLTGILSLFLFLLAAEQEIAYNIPY